MRLPWLSALAFSLLFALAIPAQGVEKAPDFSLPSVAGDTVKLSAAYPKGPVVLSFWATWCVPCPEEMKQLQQLYDKYRERGLQVIATSIDGSKTVASVRPFVTGRRFTYPVLLDTNNDVKRLYQVTAVPTVFVINATGEIAYHHVGYRPGDEVELEKEIQKVLAASPAGPQEQSGAAPAVQQNEAQADSAQQKSQDPVAPPGAEKSNPSAPPAPQSGN